MLSFINLNKKLFTLLFFISFFLIGVLIFEDYGISIDEDNTRLNGFINLKYLTEIFFPDYLIKIDEVTAVHNLEKMLPSYSNATIEESGGQGLGIIFDVPMSLFEIMFTIQDSRSFYLLRHIFNFTFFYIAIFFFFLIIKKRYNSYLFALIGSTFLILSPRIFAESFYNNKDLIFLSLFVINLFAALKFLENPNYKNVLLFSITSALSINIRILGIMIPCLVLIFFFVCILRNEKYRNHLFKLFLALFFFLIFFTVLLWPFLWNNTLGNFIKVLQSFSNYDFEIYNFYLGEHINAKYIPWHYPLVWIGVTTPLLYIFLFCIGFISMLTRTLKRLLKIEKNDSYIDLWRSNKEMGDLIIFFTFFLPLIAVIGLNSTLYDGWRHLYFIYPSFIIIGVYGINIIKIKFFKKKNILLFLLLIFFSTPTLFWMFKYHPYQNMYFNFFAGKDFNKKFDMDYWGLSNHAALIKIAQNASKKVIVSNIGTTDLHLSRSFLQKEYRDKISLDDRFENADYIINNYRDWNGRINDYESQISSNFEPFYDIKVDGISINTIYKKIK